MFFDIFFITQLQELCICSLLSYLKNAMLQEFVIQVTTTKNHHFSTHYARLLRQCCLTSVLAYLDNCKSRIKRVFGRLPPHAITLF